MMTLTMVSPSSSMALSNIRLALSTSIREDKSATANSGFTIGCKIDLSVFQFSFKPSFQRSCVANAPVFKRSLQTGHGGSVCILIGLGTMLAILATTGIILLHLRCQVIGMYTALACEYGNGIFFPHDTDFLFVGHVDSLSGGCSYLICYNQPQIANTIQSSSFIFFFFFWKLLLCTLIKVKCCCFRKAFLLSETSDDYLANK